MVKTSGCSDFDRYGLAPEENSVQWKGSDRSFGERIRGVRIHSSRYERYAKIILRHSERPGEVGGESRRSVTRSGPNTAREASRCRSYAKPSQEHKQSAGRLEEGDCCETERVIK